MGGCGPRDFEESHYFMLFADGGRSALAVRRNGAAANCAALKSCRLTISVKIYLRRLRGSRFRREPPKITPLCGEVVRASAGGSLRTVFSIFGVLFADGGRSAIAVRRSGAAANCAAQGAAKIASAAGWGCRALILCGPQPLPRFRPATHFTFACGPRRPRPDNNYVMLIMTTSQMIFFDSPPVRPKTASLRIFRRKFLFPQNIRTFAPLNSILFY